MLGQNGSEKRGRGGLGLEKDRTNEGVKKLNKVAGAGGGERGVGLEA